MRSDFSGPSRRKEGAAYQIYHVENQNAVTSSRAKFFLRGLIHSETARIWGDLVRPGGQVSAKKFNRGLVAPKIESREESRRTVERLGRERLSYLLTFKGQTTRLASWLSFATLRQISIEIAFLTAVLFNSRFLK